MDIHIWFAFASASVVLLLIPGPTVLLILSYAISQGRRVALATVAVAGVALGDLIAMTASLAGLGALVLASAALFVALKWIGAAYLVYLGVKLFRSAPSAALGRLDEVGETAPRKVFAHATMVTALNPKSIVFFIAFVPQFIDPNATLAPQFAVLIATFVGLASLNALIYAVLADKLRRRITRPSVLPFLTRLGGSALIAMGVATAAIRRSN